MGPLGPRSSTARNATTQIIVHCSEPPVYSRGIDALDDMLPNILSYLRSREIMSTRRVNKTWNEAVRKTTISPEEIFVVGSVKTYNALTVMSTVLPNLQSVVIARFDAYHSHKYNDGEDPDEEVAARFSQHISHDISILANFRKLRGLEIDYYAPLNGRYPFLFNFPFLQKLSIACKSLKWDLGALTGLPMLKELNIRNYPTGNISSLRVLKDTLEKVTLRGCSDVEGNFMILADFPQLKTLDLSDNTGITVDFGEVGSDDFPKVEELFFGNNNSNSVSGNIRSLRVLKDTLRELTLEDCPNVDGNFMALADFPHLRSLHLDNSALTVDIGELLNGDFARLKSLSPSEIQ
jgi:Leucine-rich repeat (LRR) protein